MTVSCTTPQLNRINNNQLLQNLIKTTLPSPPIPKSLSNQRLTPRNKIPTNSPTLTVPPFPLRLISSLLNNNSLIFCPIQITLFTLPTSPSSNTKMLTEMLITVFTNIRAAQVAHLIAADADEFVAAGALAIVIAFVTISYQAIKAALMNPVKSLRSE